MATPTKKATGFRVSCPYCGVKAGSEGDQPLVVDLCDVGSVVCQSCDATFTPEQAVVLATEALAEWQKVARWAALGRELVAG